MYIFPIGLVVGPPHVGIVRLPPGPSVLNITDEEIELEYKRKQQDMTTRSKVEIIVGILLLVVVIAVLIALVIALVYYQYRRAKNKAHSPTNKTSENEIVQRKYILKDEHKGAAKYHYPGKRAMKRLLLKIRPSKKLQEEEIRGLVGSDEVEEDDSLLGNKDDLSMTIEELGTERSTTVNQKDDKRRKKIDKTVVNISDRRKKIAQNQRVQKRKNGNEREKSFKTEYTEDIYEGREKNRGPRATSGRVQRQERNMKK